MTEASPEQRRVTITDPQVMRALAHPARLEIMEHLTTVDGGATATECAEIVGLSPSATSYHLRALARFGLVEQAPGRGDARERVWRSTVRSWGVDAGRSAEPEARAAERALVDTWLARDLERSRDWLRRAPDESDEWYAAAQMSDHLLMVTAEELTELNAAVYRLFEPYRKRTRAAPPEGARRVAVQYKALPLD
ncbi:ArsR/SmtB family transcription factor [Micromonospora deserti]|uniref:ArsR family transcriptional regulator n=1 Tax=Micromonospora deserti TaxID=2070366 RepID=A0A2W2DD31_9ACTN|nr:metalloregulator ArsR/SmtB family transcription factor [Micromonospora deserti]PZF97747.1 ArsR family transcriptional regulator [Micromonospora deserti]